LLDVIVKRGSPIAANRRLATGRKRRAAMAQMCRPSLNRLCGEGRPGGELVENEAPA
jgi:hypothetical protein